MSFYEIFRHFADSYGLLVLLGMFLTLCGWPFRPGAHSRNHEAASSIFKDRNDGE